MIEILDKGNVHHRLTVAPTPQRVTIKIADGSDAIERARVINFLTKVSEKIGFNIPYTLRGTLEIGATFISMRDTTKAKTRFGSFNEGDFA